MVFGTVLGQWLDNVYTMLGTCPRHDLTILRLCLSNVWNMFGQYSGRFWAMRKPCCLENVWDMFGARSKHVWDMFETCVGHLWDMVKTPMGEPS